MPRACRGWGVAPLVLLPLALLLVTLAVLGPSRSLGMADRAVLAAGYDATPATSPPARFAAPSGAFSARALPGTCSAGNRYAFAHALIIPASEWICGRVTALGGSVTVLGRVGGDVVVIGGRATVAGQVDGSVTALGGSVTLLQGARVGGSAQAYGGVVQTQGTVHVGGGIQRNAFAAVPGPVQWPFFVPGIGAMLPRLVFWALAGVLVAHFLPVPLRRVTLVLRDQPAVSAFLGAGATLAALAISILLVLTCLGIPVALVLLFGVWVAWVVGTVAVGLWLGEAILRVGPPRGRRAVLVPSVVGVLLLALAESIPCLGGVLLVVVSMLGLGGVLRSLLGARRGGQPHSWRVA